MQIMCRFFIILFSSLFVDAQCGRLLVHNFTTVLNDSYRGSLITNAAPGATKQEHTKQLLINTVNNNHEIATNTIGYAEFQDVRVLHIDGMDVYVPKNMQVDRNTKICFAWDLNSVIFEKKIKIGSMLNYARKQKGIVGAVKGSWKFFKLWRKKKKLKKQKKNEGYVWDAMFTNLAKEDPQTAAFLRTFAHQANVLDVRMIALMQELEGKGHCHAILSNMGQSMLDAQIDLLKQKSNLYDPVLFEYTLRFLQDKKYSVIASQENGWMHKPDADIYQLFLAKNQKRNATVYFFIDDKKENCIAAAQQGFVAFHYTKATPEKLKNVFDVVCTTALQ